MSLQEYRHKRDFSKTGEPPAQKATKKSRGLRFVVQKHAASHLHYDFRLEQDGVLKSWAVPKGPSLDPAQKRLAVQVEDHPLDYGNFEGIIPKGQYGGGTVMVWDEGEWEPVEDASRGLRQGKLKFRLQGKKLHGGWSLVRLKDENNWLLVKERDDFADPEADVTRHDKSALSGRSLDQIAANAERVWNSDRHGPDVAHLEGARTCVMPTDVSLQLASLAKAPPAGKDWLHELKYDGYRLLAYLDHGQVRLQTRGRQDWTQRFRKIAKALVRLPVNQAILDGEVVVLDEHGRSRFQLLQHGSGEPIFFCFDLLYCQDHDLRGVPQLQRKQALSELIGEAEDPVRYSDHVVGRGPDVLQQACELGCEGIVCKSVDGTYVGRRSRQWLKCKCLSNEEFVIVGYTRPKGGRSGFGALLMAQQHGRQLRYCGRVGTGFNEASLGQILAQLQKLQVDEAPLSHPLRGAQSRLVTWVKPRLQAQVRYAERTDEGILRHPSFVSLVAALPTPLVRPKISNPDRIIDASSGITKGELIDYYERVGHQILPHLHDRPLTTVRCPAGIMGQCFYQKHRATGLPPSVRAVEVAKSDGGTATYMRVQDVEGVLALVQMGVIEMHPWGCRSDDLEHPDRLVFDLDPDVDLGWERVVRAALEVRDKLAELGLVSYCKTTGGKGLHLVVPLQRRRGWAEARAFAKAFVGTLADDHPENYTTNPLKARRRGRIFLDYLRNGQGATSVAAYSARSRPGIPISLPISWDELSVRLEPAKITIRSSQIFQTRWEGFFEIRQSLTRSMLTKVGILECGAPEY